MMATMGELLRAARDRAGLTVDEVAETTNIPRHHIAALESDDVDALPEEPFTRGFIRIYSRALGVASEPVLAAYAQTLGHTGSTHVLPNSGWSRIRRFMAGFTLVGVLIIVLTLFFTRVPETFFLDSGSQPTTFPASLELSQGSVLQLVALRSTNLSITLDGRTVFIGSISKGSRHEWVPQREIVVMVEEADAIAVVVNGDMRGPFGIPGGAAQRSWRVTSGEGPR